MQLDSNGVIFSKQKTSNLYVFKNVYSRCTVTYCHYNLQGGQQIKHTHWKTTSSQKLSITISILMLNTAVRLASSFLQVLLVNCMLHVENAPPT